MTYDPTQDDPFFGLPRLSPEAAATLAVGSNWENDHPPYGSAMSCWGDAYASCWVAAGVLSGHVPSPTELRLALRAYRAHRLESGRSSGSEVGLYRDLINLLLDYCVESERQERRST